MHDIVFTLFDYILLQRKYYNCFKENTASKLFRGPLFREPRDDLTYQAQISRKIQTLLYPIIQKYNDQECKIYWANY